MNTKNQQPTKEQNDDKVRESVIIRGIASALQAMSFPTMQNVIDLFSKVGIKVSVNR